MSTDYAALVETLSAQADPARLLRDVTTLAGEPRSRRRAPDGMARAEAYVKAELLAAGWQAQSRPFVRRWQFGVTDHRGRTPLPLRVRLYPRLRGANIVAELPGSAAAPRVVLGAHLDTVDASPGADDNASGVAVVLEAARLLARLPVRPNITLVLFDMEELGLVGARAAARELSAAGQVEGMICVESVGFYADGPGTQTLPAGFGLLFRDVADQVRAARHRGDFTLVVHRRSSRAAAEFWRRAAARSTPALPSLALCDPRPDGPLGVLAGLAVPPLNNLGRSDHGAFWDRRIPALMLTDSANFRNPHYHQPTDTPATLDYERLATVTAATAATAVFWSQAGTRENPLANRGGHC
jgi:acetylornithine deacetylase/succinyl-diaminopimelate desuccinylase-like protein